MPCRFEPAASESSSEDGKNEDMTEAIGIVTLSLTMITGFRTMNGDL